MPLFKSLAFDQKVSALNQTQQNVWLSINNRIVLYNTLTSKILEIPFRIVDKGQIQSFYQDGNICWIGSDDGLIRYDILNNRSFSDSFKVQIRKVNCGKDSIIYHGNISSGEKNIQQLNYNLNSIYFEFAGMFFEDGSKNIYSYKLNGQDTTWSNWSNETKATFTNLKEGKYTFFVKSKNIYGAESNIASYSFIIKTPWHRTWIAYALYAVLFILAVYIFIRNRTKKLILEKEQLEKIVLERTKEIILQKDEISLQKHLVEEKHKEITDSINYAERIQRSLLASKNLLDENLKDYFIFFQPKDVVSGDFYWAFKLENNHFCFVTADSTGHGVPGAIMSILNINALKDAVNLRLTNPSDILNKSRETIINILANDGSSQGGKDGMDCSALCFDFENQILYMSLANNPVWVIRNKELIEFKPDKMPVGKHDKDTDSFSLHTFPIQKGDLIYTITDGYSDQFGGSNNKKFNSKKLKELLLQQTDLSMQKQKENLKYNFENWKGNQEQIDDVTVIGIKI
jgi:serine phosphatase RsbU (regulator of sigma subunit)